MVAAALQVGGWVSGGSKEGGITDTHTQSPWLAATPVVHRQGTVQEERTAAWLAMQTHSFRALDFGGAQLP